MSRSYSGTSTSGVLTVTSGGHAVANINMIGTYTSADFKLVADSSGHVLITAGLLFPSLPLTVGGGTALDAVSGDFHVTSENSGNVKVTDPGIVSGGSFALGAVQAFPRNGVDVPDIAFGAQTTLAFSENTTAAGASLGMTGGQYAATIALLGNYVAGSFATHSRRPRRDVDFRHAPDRAAATVDASASRVMGGFRLGALGSGRTLPLAYPLCGAAGEQRS